MKAKERIMKCYELLFQSESLSSPDDIFEINGGNKIRKASLKVYESDIAQPPT